MQQKIKIQAKDKNNHLIGTFIITNDVPDSFEDKIKTDSLEHKIDNCILENISIVEDLEDKNLIFSAIIYCKDSSEFPNILLAEETRYKIHFKPSSNYNADYNLFSTFLDDSNGFCPIDLINPKEGYLNFKSYVGKSFLDITYNGEVIFSQAIEVRSKKMDYFNQYKAMIGDLSNYASGLIFYSDSPVYQEFVTDMQSEKNFYEYFMFLEYLFKEDNLPSTFEYLSHNLYTHLKEEIQSVPSSIASNIDPNSIVEMISNPENMRKIDNDSYLSSQLSGYVSDNDSYLSSQLSGYVSDNDSYLSSQLNGYMPIELNEISYYDDIDTVENRFYKNFLETIDGILDKLIDSSNSNDYINEELFRYKEKMSYFLSKRYFKDIGRMEYPPLNSQVLQKKEGYRDILQYFLMLEFTFRMHWEDIDEKFIGYEKKLSELYELWNYFKLLEVLEDLSGKEIFFEDIFVKKDWDLSLNHGKAVSQDIVLNGKKINIELRYNKTFNKNSKFKSYSLELRPDYTFSINFDNQTYFIHFDAKYKVYLDSDSFKNEDIYKMHTYKDAILNSVGAFVLYPGNDSKPKLYKHYEGYKYGVGAFSLNPGDDTDDKEVLVGFLKELIEFVVFN